VRYRTTIAGEYLITYYSRIIAWAGEQGDAGERIVTAVDVESEEGGVVHASAAPVRRIRQLADAALERDEPVIG